MGIANQMMFNLQKRSDVTGRRASSNPKNANALNNLGTVYDSLKRYHDAAKMYRKAIKMDPKSALMLKNLGTDLLSPAQVREGLGRIQDRAALDPQIFHHQPDPSGEPGIDPIAAR